MCFVVSLSKWHNDISAIASVPGGRVVQGRLHPTQRGLCMSLSVCSSDLVTLEPLPIEADNTPEVLQQCPLGRIMHSLAERSIQFAG
jgi:hypothetical protein